MVGQGRRIASGKLTRRNGANVKGASPAGSKLFGAILLLAVATVGVSCSRSNVRAEGPAALPPPLVTVVQATAHDVPRYLDEIGRNAAFESVNVTPQVAGQVIERHFQDGENLKKGQLIFVIDPRPYKAQLDSARANLAQVRAALELAKIQFARDQELVGTRAISKQDYDTKKNTVDVNEAQVEAAKAAIETAQINLDYCYIHSPIDGRAGARLVDVGNVVQPNTTSLLSIQRLDPIYATFTITEQDLAEVQKRMSRGMLKALVRRRYGGIAPGYFGAATRQRCGDRQRARGGGTGRAGRTVVGAAGKQSACRLECPGDGACPEDGRQI